MTVVLVHNESHSCFKTSFVRLYTCMSMPYFQMFRISDECGSAL